MKKKIIVFSDIDGTLIQKASDTDNTEGMIKISQTKYGSSYMTVQANELLHDLDSEIEFVFTTSRGAESYSKIDWGFIPKHVLIEGGSVLLTDGKKDEQWEKVVRSIMGDDFSLLSKLRELVCNFGYSMKYEKNEYLLDFFDNDYKINKDEQQKQKKFEIIKNKLYENPVIKEKFNVYSHNNGMMIVYKKLEKGQMIKKYIERFKNNGDVVTISMGDALTDSTMFDITDYSFGPKGSGATYEYNFSKSFESRLGFTIFILNGINNLLKERDYAELGKVLIDED